MREMRELTEKAADTEGKLAAVFPLVKDMIQIKELFFTDSSGLMRGTNDRTLCFCAEDIENVVNGEIYSENTLEPVKKNSPLFYESLVEHGFESVMVVRVRRNEETKGFLVCAVKRSLRIWQDSECALMYFLSELISS
jgi:hypothetical protein